jgi:hypothetical protein
MDDEERYEYLKYRHDRDIVRAKDQPAPKEKADDKEKEKKPFVDHVLEKALEHLRGKVEKVGAAAAFEGQRDA